MRRFAVDRDAVTKVNLSCALDDDRNPWVCSGLRAIAAYAPIASLELEQHLRSVHGWHVVGFVANGNEAMDSSRRLAGKKHLPPVSDELQDMRAFEGLAEVAGRDANRLGGLVDGLTVVDHELERGAKLAGDAERAGWGAVCEGDVAHIAGILRVASVVKDGVSGRARGGGVAIIHILRLEPSGFAGVCALDEARGAFMIRNHMLDRSKIRFVSLEALRRGVLSMSEVASRAGVSRMAVWKWAKEAGIDVDASRTICANAVWAELLTGERRTPKRRLRARADEAETAWNQTHPHCSSALETRNGSPRQSSRS